MTGDSQALHYITTHGCCCCAVVRFEISIVGHRLRLQEVNNTDKHFGEASVIVFGDLFLVKSVQIYSTAVQCSSSKPMVTAV